MGNSPLDILAGFVCPWAVAGGSSEVASLPSASLESLTSPEQKLKEAPGLFPRRPCARGDITRRGALGNFQKPSSFFKEKGSELKSSLKSGFVGSSPGAAMCSAGWESPGGCPWGCHLSPSLQSGGFSPCFTLLPEKELVRSGSPHQRNTLTPACPRSPSRNSRVLRPQVEEFGGKGVLLAPKSTRIRVRPISLVAGSM